MESSKIHFKGLNGLRAIAAFAVVFSHIGIAREVYGISKTKGIDLAGFGVSIFFSLSGFLITYLLLSEKRKFGAIDIKKFYIRRILRIWPLYFWYLFLAVLTIYFTEPSLLPGSLGYYLFLGANIPFILNVPLPYLVHYWSLGVEEQFYLFWPWVVKRVDKLFTTILVFTLSLVILKIFLRYWTIRTGNDIPYSIIHTTQFHCMSTGALGAILFFNKNQLFLKIVNSLPAQLLAWGSIVLMAFNKFHIASVIDNEIVAALTVVLIINLAVNEKSLIHLEYPLFDYLGRISFGIYVYHPLLIFLTGKLSGQLISNWPLSAKYIFIYSILPLLTVAVASLSYYGFEKRFIDAKARFSKVVSAA